MLLIIISHDWYNHVALYLSMHDMQPVGSLWSNQRTETRGIRLFPIKPFRTGGLQSIVTHFEPSMQKIKGGLRGDMVF